MQLDQSCLGHIAGLALTPERTQPDQFAWEESVQRPSRLRARVRVRASASVHVCTRACVCACARARACEDLGLSRERKRTCLGAKGSVRIGYTRALGRACAGACACFCARVRV